jgi:hypothetical protein
MAREPLERLLEAVTDEELESLRDAILREEGRRRVQLNLTIDAPFPPLSREEGSEENVVTRWAKLITWLAKEADFPPAERKRGVSIKLVYTGDELPDTHEAGIMLQEALVEAGLLLGRESEWVDSTITESERGLRNAVIIQMWDKPDSVSWEA